MSPRPRAGRSRRRSPRWVSSRARVARSLVQRRSQTLGVIATGLELFGVAQTLNGITDESQRADYALLLNELANEDVGGVRQLLSTIEMEPGQTEVHNVTLATELFVRDSAPTADPEYAERVSTG